MIICVCYLEPWPQLIVLELISESKAAFYEWSMTQDFTWPNAVATELKFQRKQMERGREERHLC